MLCLLKLCLTIYQSGVIKISCCSFVYVKLHVDNVWKNQRDRAMVITIKREEFFDMPIICRMVVDIA